MNSALYHGVVSHKRFAPRAHSFSYRMGLLYLDLDEQTELKQLSPWACAARFAAFSFRERDYLPHLTRQGIGLKQAVLDVVEQTLGIKPSGAVCVLTQPRSWGLSFNPVSFFYCYEADGRLAAIVCEVSNTPWRERYHYALPASVDQPLEHVVEKSFHVSPFLPRELIYRMRFSPVGEQLRVDMQDWQGDQLVFEAHLALKRQVLSRSSLHQHLRSFPWMTGKTVLAIYWQALRLLLKRTPFYSHQPAQGTARAAQLESRHD